MFSLDGLTKDLAYSFRTAAKSPGFTAAAFFTLVLGIGATTAIFSVVNAVLLRPLPYPDADRLVHVLANDPGDSRAGIAYGSYRLWRSQSRTFQDLAVYYRNTGWSRVTIGGVVEPQSGQAGFVSANFFSVLGVSPVIGRVFDEAEERGRSQVAVLSDALWDRFFARDPAVIGKTIEIDGRPFTIIGVMPGGVGFPAPEALLWLPVTTNQYWLDQPQRDSIHGRGYYMRWNVVGRLRAGATPQVALGDVTRISGGLAAEDADWNMGLGLKVVPLSVEISGNARLALLVLFASAAFVLLIACGNVANLMLVRDTIRARELAIRSALGASQRRIIRQVLSESFVLASAAGACAVLVARAAIRLLVRFGPADLPRLDETRIDLGVLCFALAMAVLATLVSSALPAWRASRSDPIEALRSGGRTHSAGPARIRAGTLLVVSEVAVAVVLLTGAGLLLRSLREIGSVDLGFHPDNVLTMRVRLPNGTSMNRQQDFHQELHTRLAGLRGVQFVGGISGLFELDRPPLNSLRVVEGRTSLPETRGSLTWATVSGDYFRAMGIPLLAGRHFSGIDTARTPLVAIIDEAMARRYWPNENPIGRRFKGQDERGRNDEWLTVIGVAKNARRQGLDQAPTPHVYEWSRQAGPTTDWIIRTARDPAGFASLVRLSVRETDPRAGISGLMTLKRQVEMQTETRRFRTWLLSLFALLAVLLATIGIHGVIRYATLQRTHEIGVRMALGARRSSILGMILRQGLRLALAGLAAGTAAALALTRMISSLLFGVTPTDPVTFTAVAAILLGVAGFATLLPAMRATRVDPLTSLRAE